MLLAVGDELPRVGGILHQQLVEKGRRIATIIDPDRGSHLQISFALKDHAQRDGSAHNVVKPTRCRAGSSSNLLAITAGQFRSPQDDHSSGEL